MSSINFHNNEFYSLWVSWSVVRFQSRFLVLGGDKEGTMKRRWWWNCFAFLKQTPLYMFSRNIEYQNISIYIYSLLGIFVGMLKTTKKSHVIPKTWLKSWQSIPNYKGQFIPKVDLLGKRERFGSYSPHHNAFIHLLVTSPLSRTTQNIKLQWSFLIVTGTGSIARHSLV